MGEDWKKDSWYVSGKYFVDFLVSSTTFTSYTEPPNLGVDKTGNEGGNSEILNIERLNNEVEAKLVEVRV